MALNKRRVNEHARTTAAIVHTIQLRQGLSEEVAQQIIATWLDLIAQQDGLNEPLAPSAIRTLVKRLQKSADGAAMAMSGLPMDVHMLLGPLIKNLSTSKFSGMLPYAAASAEHLKSLSEQLTHLSAVASNALLSLKSKGGRPIKVQRRYLLAEIAFLFEFLTGQRAARRISGPDSGKQVPYGPFWQFLSSCWEGAGENVRGLDGLFAKWLRERKPNWRVSVLTLLKLRDVELWNKLSKYGHPFLP